MTNPNLYTVGGTVQAGGGIYIPRLADETLLRLCLERVFAYVLTPRQMGKSSLMVRTSERLRAEGVRTAIVDLQDLGTKLTAAEWYFGFLVKLQDELELDTDVVEWWQTRSHLGVAQRLTMFFEQVLLAEIKAPVTIFVDEIDSTLSLDFTDDFFVAIRSLYVARATQREFGRLSFVLIGVATPGDLIADAKRTPFNVGKRVDLTDFTLEEAIPLAAGLGELAVAQQRQVLGWVLGWTGGHPYLTQRLCQEMAQVGGVWTEADVGRLVSRLFLGVESEQDNNLQFVRDMLTKRAPEPVAVMQTYRQVWRGKPAVVDDEQSLVKSHLKLAGVVKRVGKGLVVRNPIYRRVFDRRWIREQLPESLWKRLKPAMPIIAALLFGFIGMSGIAVYANHQTTIANLRGQAADALYSLTTPYQVDGMVLAIQAVAESRKKSVPEAYKSSDDSLLRAVQIVRERNALKGHTDYVHSVAFSPDGQRIVSGSRDKTVRLWDLQGQTIGQPFKGHTDSVYSVAFSPDGQRIVSGSEDKTVRLWDLQGQAIGQPFQGHTDSVYSVAFSPDGQRIVSGSRDKTVRLWDLQGQTIGQPFKGHTSFVTSVAFSPDGQRIVSGSWDKTVRLWDLQGKAIGQPFKGHTSFVTSVAFSPDGQRIVSGSGSGEKTVRLWDLQGQTIGQPFKGHKAYVTSVAFSPDGQRIVSGSGDKTVRLWDLQSQAIGQPLKGHTAYVTSVAFSPDGQRIVSGSGDKTVRLWDLQGQAIGQPFQGHTDSVTSVAFSPDGQRIVSGSRDKTVRLWDLQGQAIGQPFQGHTDSVASVVFSPDGQRIVSGSWDNTVRLWDLQGKAIGQPFQGHTDSVTSVVFSPDGQRIVSGSWDNTVRLWDLQGQAIGQPFQGHTSFVTSVSFSSDEQRIVSSSADNTVRLWDLQGQAIGQPFQGHTDSVTSVSFSPDEQRIVSGSRDNTVRLWDLQGKAIGQPFQGHKAFVYSVSFSPDGQRIVSGDNTVRLWQGDWHGWLKTACTQLSEHSVLRNPEQSFDPVVTKEAKEACDYRIWETIR
jgi:WD40 repeat protein